MCTASKSQMNHLVVQVHMTPTQRRIDRLSFNWIKRISVIRKWPDNNGCCFARYLKVKRNVKISFNCTQKDENWCENRTETSGVESCILRLKTKQKNKYYTVFGHWLKCSLYWKRCYSQLSINLKKCVTDVNNNWCKQVWNMRSILCTNKILQSEVTIQINRSMLCSHFKKWVLSVH